MNVRVGVLYWMEECCLTLRCLAEKRHKNKKTKHSFIGDGGGDVAKVFTRWIRDREATGSNPGSGSSCLLPLLKNIKVAGSLLCPSDETITCGLV